VGLPSKNKELSYKVLDNHVRYISAVAVTMYGLVIKLKLKQ